MTPNKRQTLSVCMIVRNEERFLEDCLESIRNIADQIVIVDTGSTDKTRDIAGRFDAEIYDFEWCEDFSAARNESIKYAGSDWIFWLDADERLRQSSISELRTLLVREENAVVYNVNIYSPKGRGADVHISSAHRLFTNHRGIYFTGKIHEQLSQSVAQLKGEERYSSIQLDHLGYALDSEGQNKKNQRNRALLEKAVAENPHSAYFHYTLAQHFAVAGEPEKAQPHFKKAYDLKQFGPEMTASLLNTMAENLLKLNRAEEAIRFCKKSIKLFSIQVGGYYMLYKISNYAGKTREAIRWLEMLVAKNRHVARAGKRISTDITIEESQIYQTLATLYEKEGDEKQAGLYARKAHESNPSNTIALEQLVRISLKQKNYPDAIKYLRHLNTLVKGNAQYIDLLGTLLIRERRFSEATGFYEEIVRQFPQNQAAVKRLAGLYAKTGSIEMAKQLLENA